MTTMRRLFALMVFVAIGAQWLMAQKDYTSRVGGAACDEAAAGYWYLEGQSGTTVSVGDGYDATLQCDTWSGRGANDGSLMTTPFMEYWKNKQSNTGTACNLPAAQIRHQTITGLPQGTYQVSMRVRCYAETYNNMNAPAGVTLWANGVESSDLCVGTPTSYSGGIHITSTPAVTCEVGEDGQLSFGLNVSAAAARSELNWVGWKNVKLTQLTSTGLTAGATYYLRNKGTGLWLEAGGKWGTHGVMGQHGSALVPEKVGEGTYILATQYYNGDIHYLMGGYDTNTGTYSLYLDGQLQQWQIQAVESGGFTLYNADYGYLYADDTTVLPDGSDASDDYCQWEFVSESDRIRSLLDGSEPDATFLVSNPRIDRNFNGSMWEGTFSQGGINSWTGYGNQVAEVWGGNTSTIQVQQTLLQLPNGRYRLSVQGFYRYNDDTYEDQNGKNNNYRALETYQNGETDKLYAQLFATSGGTTQTAPLQSIASQTDEIASLGLPAGSYGLPFSMEEAGLAFTSGLYSDNTLTIDVTNHQLTIGIKKDQHDGTDWTLWDNFTLTLLQPGDNTGYQIPGEAQEEGDIDWASASSQNPVDATSMLQNPDFTSTGGWSGSPKLATGTDGQRIVSYGGTGVARSTYTVSQTVSDLRNGLYRVTLNGFYRYGDVQTEEHDTYGGDNENTQNNVWATYTIPYATIARRIGHESLLAKMAVNGTEVSLPSIFDGAQAAQSASADFETEHGWVPGTVAAAAQAFSEDRYKVEALAIVNDGTLTITFSKSLGYKYDWTCFDNVRLHYLGTDAVRYVTDITASPASLTLSPGQQVQLSAQVVPADATVPAVIWRASGSVSVTDQGLVTALSEGSGTIRLYAQGGEYGYIYREVPCTVGAAGGDASQLVINEIQVSNLDQTLDPSGNYGGWIELYNPTDKAVALNDCYLSDDASNPYKSRVINSNFFVPAHGHQLLFFDHNAGESGNTNSNANFKLDMDGGTILLYDAGGTLLASETYPKAVARTSWARLQDGFPAWGTTACPTPRASNSGSPEFLDPESPRVATPTASPGSGFLTTVGLLPTIEGEGTILCTTDGSVPSQAWEGHEQNGISPDELKPFTGPTVLRLRAFQPGKLPSPVATYTYAEPTHQHTLPVLMVAADERDLYSDERGIFVTGTKGVTGAGLDYACNWNLDWDRAAHMQLLSSQGETLFEQDVNLARFGGWSRSWYPYNFKLKAQKQYEGYQYLEHPFFTRNKPYLKHKVLQVRNGGNDVSCRIKDAAIQQIILRSGFYLDCLDYQPVHCYVNGRYCGMQNLREPSNKHFGLADYGIDTDEMDAMEITGGLAVKAGDASAFWQWYNLSQSAADESSWQQLCQLVDVDEFANYMAAQLYLGGDDWPGNNCKGFKGKDGKFHIVFFDVDQALRYDRSSLSRVTNNNAYIMRLFRGMLQNETFRKQFIDSFCLFGGSVMQVQRCHDIIDEMSAEMDPALALEGLSTQPTAGYMKQTLSETRRETMISALKQWWPLGLSSDVRSYRVSLKANVEGAKLQVNGLDVPMAEFDGVLLAPAIVTATAPEGYTFQAWKSGRLTLSTKQNFDLSGLSDTQAQGTTLAIQAVFQPLATDEEMKEALALPIKVNEVSAGNTIFASETWDRADWIELYNTTDQPIDVDGLYLSDDVDQPLKFQIKKNSEACNTIVPAKGHLIVWADGEGANPDFAQIHASFKLSNSDGQQVVAVSGDDFVAANPDYFEAHPAMQSFIDGLTYSAHRGDETVGRYPDGGSQFYRMGRPTIERTNMLLSADTPTGTDENLMDLLPGAFTLDLAKGWNWTSHLLHSPFAPADLSAHAQRIVGQRQEAVRNGQRMVGTLNYLDAARLFKVQMSQADTYTSTRQWCDQQMGISLTPGWNWLGYPVDGAQTVSAALAGYLADEGDKLVGQDGFATYSGGEWTGSLSTLETGKGYMLYTQRAKSFSFAKPKTAIHLVKARRKLQQQGTTASRYGFDKHRYPNVMGMVGVLLSDGQPVAADSYTLLAYSEGECRGAAQWLGSQLYLTAYGQGGETLQFFALDEQDGQLYPVEEQHTFTPDVMGTTLQPCVFSIGLGEATSIAEVAGGTSPHTTVEGYYSLSGLRVGGSASSLAPGIYIVKYADGSFRKIQKR